jgi:hypothetical protein
MYEVWGHKDQFGDRQYLGVQFMNISQADRMRGQGYLLVEVR